MIYYILAYCAMIPISYFLTIMFSPFDDAWEKYSQTEFITTCLASLMWPFLLLLLLGFVIKALTSNGFNTMTEYCIKNSLMLRGKTTRVRKRIYCRNKTVEFE